VAAPPPPPTPPVTELEAHREAKALIDATWTVAARTGSVEPSVRDILQEAGLSTKAFYRHFHSKDDLMVVAYAEGTRVLTAFLEKKIGAHTDPVARIDAWIEAYARQASPPLARRTLPWSLGIGRLALLFPDDFNANQAAIVALLDREITSAVAAGVATTPDPAGDAWLIFGYTVDTVRRHLLSGLAPSRPTVLRLVSFAHRALQCEPAPGRAPR